MRLELDKRRYLNGLRHSQKRVLLRRGFLSGTLLRLYKNCGLSGERPTTRTKFSAFYVSLRVARACGEMFPIDPDSRTSRRERSQRSTKPSRAANRRLDPQTLRESSSYALLVNGLSDENSRTKLQNVVADSRAGSVRATQCL